jgi:hypothetical protein
MTRNINEFFFKENNNDRAISNVSLQAKCIFGERLIEIKRMTIGVGLFIRIVHSSF